MRILHLATSTNGGAGIAAKRIVESQVEAGLESFLLTRDNQSNNLRVAVKKTLGKVITLGSKLIVTGHYGVVSPVSISSINLKQIEEFRPEILHIHNWYNFLTPRDMAKLSSRYPIAFTLHDSRLATGGCHVTLGCKRFESDCKGCPASRSGAVIRLSKKNLDKHISKMKRFVVISPSHWMLNELKNSLVIHKAIATEVIGNPAIAGKNLLLTKEMQDPIRMCFISATLDSEFKGLKLLKQALQILSENRPELRANVSLVGNTKKNHDSVYGGIRLRTLGNLDSREINPILEKTDILLVPSQSDNHPSVITEGQFSGAIVVATRVGGIPEMIEDGFDGFLSENNAKDFADSILRAISTKDVSAFRTSARDSAFSRKVNSSKASAYLRVYENLLAQ